MVHRLLLLIVALAWLGPGAAAEPVRHPGLFLKAGDLPGLREKFNRPAFADYRQVLLAEADALMAYNGEGDNPPELPAKQRAFKLAAQRKQPVLNILPWAYVLTGDTAYRDMFLRVMQYDFDAITNGKLLFDPKEFQSEFKMVQFAVHAAAAYDLLYNELTPEQRTSFETYLDQALALYLNREKASWGWGNNIGCIYFSSAAIVAMSRLEGNPAAKGVLEDCVAKMKSTFYRSSIEPHPDGGYPEGPLYRNFAMLWNLALVDVYERVTGRTDHGLLDPPFFKNSQRYVETLLGGDGGWITFNDCQPQWYGAPSCAWLAARFDQPFMRWAADYLVRNYNAEPVATRSRGLQPTYWVMTFLWRDRAPAPAQAPALPTLSMLPSLHTGTIRSEGVLKPGLLLGVRGHGKAEAGHAQADGGSFVLYARGENFLIDPGYFQGEAAAHSLPQVGRAVPDAKSKNDAPLAGREQGDLRSFTVDSTALYPGPDKGGPEKVRRSFLVVGSEAVVVVDDIRGSGPILSRFQCGFPVEAASDGLSAVIRGNRTHLVLAGDAPSLKLAVEGPIDFGKSWIYKRLADAGRISWHRLTGEYAPDPERPAVWVFLPAAPGASPPSARITRTPGLIEVRLPSGRTARFAAVNGGWDPATGAKP